MHSKIKNYDPLPTEISIFEKIHQSEHDPVKKEIFSFKELNQITKTISAFPIKAEEYYHLKYNMDSHKQLLIMMSLGYIGYHTYEKKKNTKVVIGSTQLENIIKFINKIYDIDRPIKDKIYNNILWVYPKLELKKFLSNCIINNLKDNYYIDDLALTKLIKVMAGFVKYEYTNASENVEQQLDELNLPTMILANIGLYEKGYIELSDQKDGVEIKLNLSNHKKHLANFTQDRERIKLKILDIINYYENTHYTVHDFIE